MLGLHPTWVEEPLILRAHVSIFKRDLIFWYFSLGLLLVSVPFVYPDLMPGRPGAFTASHAELVLIPLSILCFLQGLGKSARRLEKMFWYLFAGAFSLWLVSKFIYTFVPGLAMTYVPDLLMAAFYVLLLAAVDTRPFRSDAEASPDLEDWLRIFGVNILIVGWVVYFALLPSSHAGSLLDRVPALNFTVAAGLFLLLRVAFVLFASPSGKWRVIYGWITVTAALWVAVDSLWLLSKAGRLEWAAGSALDLLWFVPHLPLVLAARFGRQGGVVTEEPGGTAVPVGPEERLATPRNFLVVYALAFPILHIGLYTAGLLAPALRPGRDRVVLVCGLLLGALALIERLHLERKAHATVLAQRDAEEALQTSERRYRALVESGQGLICTHDMNGVFLSVNPAAARLLGYEPGEMVGKHVGEFLTPWSLERVDEYFGYLKRDGVDEGLIRARARDGSEQVWVYQSTLFEQPGAEPIVLGHAQDITGRVRAEEALRESEARNRALLDAIPDMMFILGRDGTIHDFKGSREVDPILPPEELLGRKLSEVLPQELAERTLPYIAHALASGEVIVYEYDLPSPGDRVHFEGRLVALGEDKVVAMVRDITDRKRAEAALQRSEAALEEAQRIAHIGSWDWDLIRNTVVRSPEASRLFRLPEQTGNPEAFLAVVHPEDLPRVKASLEACLERGQHYDVVYRLRYADGAVRDVHARGEVLHNEQGEAVRMIGTAQDITEERAVARFKDEIISIVSHELRTPLTAVRGSLGLLSAGILGAVSKQAKRMLEVATNNTDRLVRLLNDILDLERLKAGKTELARSRWEVAEMIEEVGQIMTPDAERAGVVLEIVPDQVFAFADRDRIVQVLTNLLSNAIKFSPPEGKVWLRVRGNGTELLFQVEDQGRGIPEDKVDAIFGRFEQVDSSDARERGGAGLGLAICRSIVEQHGGRIWATSRLHEGSVFSFTVPTEPESGE